ncbi:large conductance mechanosensitive channel protein MscL [Actinosynnema pretiosum subsp. pretiosum]|uniref:Large-conductance mechanosensitive channel n=2 Tax=Actinosynnema TaxID=40566 RepID=C6WJF5_ACTMD|nr:large conductance mechanosensitive channel protein [Actinosynnema mirum DSM 43827]AXX27950.1 Large-conductance mechanosensitive channel [Actinosynnema pretiosum subsp. pretiosum]QUF07632.1 large conductance mechanosensitive channel protein MscL [Actinosynnema pretiosum subsp. pretiosum]
MIKGFKDFLMRGNVIDLAVAVVIGAAFGSIVTAFTNNLINPLVALVGGMENPVGFAVQLGASPKTTMDFGALVTAVMNFVIIAAVIYFVFVLPMNKIKERRERGQEAGPSEPTDVELLKEIRDLMVAQASQGNQGAQRTSAQSGPQSAPQQYANQPGTGPRPAQPPRPNTQQHPRG